MFAFADSQLLGKSTVLTITLLPSVSSYVCRFAVFPLVRALVHACVYCQAVLDMNALTHLQVLLSHDKKNIRKVCVVCRFTWSLRYRGNRQYQL